MCRRCGVYDEIKYARKRLVGKPEGKRPFERPEHEWKDNIETDLIKQCVR
jgi:hypothetical protein